MERIFQFGIRDSNSYRVVKLKESHLESTGGMIRIGRHDRCEIQISQLPIVHSIISAKGNCVAFLDLGNSPVSLINEKPVLSQSRTMLDVGDRIDLGGTMLTGGTTITLERNYLQPDG